MKAMLAFRRLPLRGRLYAQEEIEQVAYPHNCENGAPYRDLAH